MTAEPGVSVEEFLAALKRRGIPLPFEIGTFLALEVCEAVVRAPVRVAPGSVRVDDEGRLAVGSASRVSDEEACRAVVVLLGDLLVRSAPGVPPMLLRLVEHGPGEGEWVLARLRDELEAALVPLNRAATRRVLARLVREGQRDDTGPAKRISAPPEASEVDAEVDALLGVAPGGAGPAALPPSPPAVAPDVPAQASGAPRTPVPQGESDRSREAGVTRSDELGRGLDDFERAAASQGRRGVLGVALVALALAAIGVLAWWAR